MSETVFTFGRDHEKKCSAEYIRDPDELPTIHRVIDAVHDFLDGNASQSDIAPIISKAFTQGGSGVWEQAGNWLAKLSSQFPGFSSLWEEYASHPSWKVRFRVAAFSDHMPDDTFWVIVPKLLADKSARVRRKIAGDVGRLFSRRERLLGQLKQRLAVENHEEVLSAIHFAIEELSTRRNEFSCYEQGDSLGVSTAITFQRRSLPQSDAKTVLKESLVIPPTEVCPGWFLVYEVRETGDRIVFSPDTVTYGFLASDSDVDIIGDITTVATRMSKDHT